MANERRLIDANALYEKATRAWDDTLCDECYSEIINLIDEAPTVDAVEVVHGRWEQVYHDGSWRVDRCSICHRRMHYVDYDQPYAYCPNCGAKMDGERKDNEKG